MFILFNIFRWQKSEAKKDGVDAEISKYDGKSLLDWNICHCKLFHLLNHMFWVTATKKILLIVVCFQGNRSKKTPSPDSDFFGINPLEQFLYWITIIFTLQIIFPIPPLWKKKMIKPCSANFHPGNWWLSNIKSDVTSYSYNLLFLSWLSLYFVAHHRTFRTLRVVGTTLTWSSEFFLTFLVFEFSFLQILLQQAWNNDFIRLWQILISLSLR